MLMTCLVAVDSRGGPLPLARQSVGRRAGYRRPVKHVRHMSARIASASRSQHSSSDLPGMLNDATVNRANNRNLHMSQSVSTNYSVYSTSKKQEELLSSTIGYLNAPNAL